jgi:hypothetical protein
MENNTKINKIKWLNEYKAGFVRFQPLPAKLQSPYICPDGNYRNYGEFTHSEYAKRCAVNADLTRGERLQIMLTPEELDALDNWRFGRRMPSRAAAVRELLKRGLAAEGFDLAAGGSKSQDFGVTGKSTSSPSSERRTAADGKE